MEEINITIEKIIKEAEIGLLRKIMKLPFEIRRDCRNVSSKRGPKIRAKTSGEASKSNFFIKYPTMAKTVMTITSPILLLRL